MTRDTILFVTHDASPTGAPFLLLHLLRWLRANTNFTFRVAIARAGPLEEQFSKLAPVAVFGRLREWLSGRTLARMAPLRVSRFVDRWAFQRALGQRRFALVYSNTLVNGQLLKTLSDQHCPLISHVHELEYMISRFTTPEDLTYTLQRTTQFIAGSRAVAENLVENHNVDQARIDVVHEFIPLLGLDSVRFEEAARRTRADLGIDEGAFVVGAAGTLDWRKGYDVFIALALGMLRARPREDIHFVWVGGAGAKHILLEIRHDLRKLGLEPRVHIVGHRGNYLDYLATFDTLCLTSREDPFPLVVLESAALGKPVICFGGGGGSPEFVESDCGFVVPYLDVPEMAARLGELMDNPVLRHEFGRNGAAKVKEHHDVAVVAPKIVEIIQRYLNDPSLGE